jgi:hypothetical protein
MDLAARQDYLLEISPQSETFADRLQALLSNTWDAIRPHSWSLALAVLVGAVVGILLVWLIARVVIALAYSIVGTATIFLGAQAALLGAGVPVVSDLQPQRWLLPSAFVTVTVIGWVWQLFYGGARKSRKETPKS